MIPKKFDELKLTGNLPSPSGVGLAILQLTRDERSPLKELSRVIKADPALTGRMVKLANSVHGQEGEVHSIDQAIGSLGERSVRALSLGFSLISGDRNEACAGFPYDAYWSSSLARAILAEDLSKRIGGFDDSEAFTYGLLCDIGAMVLATIHTETYSSVLLEVKDQGLAHRIREETRVFGISFPEVSEAMMLDWGLPHYGVQAVSNFRDCFAPEEESAETEPDEEVVGSDLAAILFLAQGIVSFLGGQVIGGAGVHNDWDLLVEIAAGHGLAEEDLYLAADNLVSEWDYWADTLRDESVRWGDLRELARRVASSNDEEQSDGLAPVVDAIEQVVSDGKTEKPVRLLAVDDDPKILRLLGHILGKHGYDIQTAENGQVALEMICDDPPGIVITDWDMPGMDGIELCQAIRRMESGKSVYVLILTSKEDEEKILRGFMAGADDYVVKPLQPRILLARVNAGRRLMALEEQVRRDKRKHRQQVAELAKLNRKLHAASITDVLTELPNRRYAMGRLAEEWDHAIALDRPLSVVMVDIDHFKAVNDTYGHDTGDVVLRETAATLRSFTRRSDVVCRMGGEEFLIINVNSDAEASGRCAERVRAAVEANMIKCGEFDKGVTISLGAAQMHDGTANIDALLKDADDACYEAKKAGRNRWIAAEIPEEERRLPRSA